MHDDARTKNGAHTTSGAREDRPYIIFLLKDKNQINRHADRQALKYRITGTRKKN